MYLRHSFQELEKIGHDVKINAMRYLVRGHLEPYRIGRRSARARGPHVLTVYSCRRATSGSTPAAQRAGTYEARVAAATSRLYDTRYALSVMALPRATPMIQSTPDGIVISIRVIPRARRSGLAGTRGDALLVRLRAPPVDQAANAELIDVMAAALQVPKRAISIVAGDRSRQKRVRASGIDAATAASRLRQRAG